LLKGKNADIMINGELYFTKGDGICMGKKKIIIFAAAAILVLAVGILIGTLISGNKGGSAPDEGIKLAETTGTDTKTSGTDSETTGTDAKTSGTDSETAGNDVEKAGNDSETADSENDTDNKEQSGVNSDKAEDNTGEAGKDISEDNSAGEGSDSDDGNFTNEAGDITGENDANSEDNLTADNDTTNTGSRPEGSAADKTPSANDGNSEAIKIDNDATSTGSKPGSTGANSDKDTDRPGSTGANSDKDTDKPGSTGANSDTGTGSGKISSSLNTGKLTEKGNGYEGTKGSGKYNYGEALQKSLLFYELQRSGDLPEKVRCNWRGDSGLKDGSDAGLDLTGGWYDAGDNVKFNLPMAYTAAMLGWSIYESYDAYKESGQLEYALSNIKWANDYFIKCHPEDEVYYYQVGDGNQDHSYWGAAETVEYRMSRPSYKVTKSNPGSAVCGETAASLAVCSIVYKDIDKAYSDKCLKHAKSLYKFAADTKSDAGYTAANGFYNSWSGFYDELSWASAWLYIATGDKSYLNDAKSYFTKAGHDYDWAMCWDDVHIGALTMLAKLTGESAYKQELEKHLDWWSGLSSSHISYSPKGLAWLDSWG